MSYPANGVIGVCCIYVGQKHEVFCVTALACFTQVFLITVSCLFYSVLAYSEH